jgi:hypothetical protein
MQDRNELANPHRLTVLVNVSIFDLKRGNFSDLHAANLNQIGVPVLGMNE